MRAQLLCPECGSPGRSVSVKTLAHLVDEREVATNLVEPRFCTTANCGVVYFDESGAAIPKQALRVRVFQKETDADRPVCYCFGHSAADVLAAEGDSGNDIVAAITTACRQGLDRCEETNPQGRCCLGNVRALATRVPTSSNCCTGGESPSHDKHDG